jgi:hypothetical protein
VVAILILPLLELGREVLLPRIDGTVKSPFLRTSDEVVLFTGVQEEDWRVFFRCFLIGHLASNPDMDGYLEFTPPVALALSNECL